MDEGPVLKIFIDLQRGQSEARLPGIGVGVPMPGRPPAPCRRPGATGPKVND
jgi:hypothetical protein